jgi:hypothetical protein
MEFEAFERNFLVLVIFLLIFVWKGRPREKRTQMASNKGRRRLLFSRL